MPTQSRWQHRFPYFVLLLAPLLWGGNAIAGKLANGLISPATLTSSRWAGAVLLMAVFGWRYLKHDLPVIKQHWLLLLGLGIFGFGLFNLLLYSGLTLTSSLNISLVQATISFFILCGTVLLGQNVPALQWLGACVSVFGVALVVTQGELSKLSELAINHGDFLGLLACIAYALYSLGLRFRPDIHWASYLFIAAFGGLLISLPFCLNEVLAGDAIQWRWETLALVLYVILGPSTVAQLCFVWGVETIGAARAGLFINFVPIFGALLSVLLLSESFETYHLYATLLVAAGIVISEWQNRQPNSE